MTDMVDGGRELSESSKMEYVKPDLVDIGKISDVTLSNGNDMGADGAYS
jgi:hypothetical protein